MKFCLGLAQVNNEKHFDMFKGILGILPKGLYKHVCNHIFHISVCYKSHNQNKHGRTVIGTSECQGLDDQYQTVSIILK